MDPAVPAEDSNRHTDRVFRGDDHDVGHFVENTGEWKLLPVISKERYDKIENPLLAKRYIVVGNWAIVNRELYTSKQRVERFSTLPQTATATDHARMKPWERELYEVRPGVVGEYQLYPSFREAWGQ